MSAKEKTGGFLRSALELVVTIAIAVGVAVALRVFVFGVYTVPTGSMLDTIHLPEEKQIDKIKVVSVAPIFAEAIARTYSDKPISPLFG